jgi:predicted N-acetyltransferase YhbS
MSWANAVPPRIDVNMKAPATIRLATPADDFAVGELLVASFVEQYAKKMPEVVVTPERMADLRAVAEKRAVATVWVAEQAGVIVGTVALWPPGSNRSEAWLPGACDLRHLAVSSVARGLGVSNQLLEAAEEKARALRSSVICLHVRRGASGVARVYTQRGYVRAPGGDLEFPSVSLDAYVKVLQA